jgi:Zn-dependent M28 family amino/carboxypeptidase
MKTIPNSITAGLLAIGLSGASFADFIQLSDRTFTLMLTVKSSAPGLTVKDDTGETYSSYEDSYSDEDKNGNITKEVEKYSAVAKTYKLGNKEIVKLAYDNGLLEDNKISGWALVVTNDGEQPSIQLNKRIDGEDVYVDVGISLSEDSSIGDLAAKYDNVTSYSYKYDPEFESYEQTSEVNTVSGSYTEEGEIGLELDGLSVWGLYSGSAKIMSFYPRYEDENGSFVEDKTEAYYEYIPAAARMTGLVGTGETEDGGFMVITGSGSIGAGKGVIVRE